MLENSLSEHGINKNARARPCNWQINAAAAPALPARLLRIFCVHAQAEADSKRKLLTRLEQDLAKSSQELAERVAAVAAERAHADAAAREAATLRGEGKAAAHAAAKMGREIDELRQVCTFYSNVCKLSLD